MAKAIKSIIISCILGLTLRYYFGASYPVIAGLSAGKDALIILGSRSKRFTVSGILHCAVYSTFTALGLGIIPVVYRSLMRRKK